MKIIECPTCESKVSGKLLYEKTYGPGEYWEPGAFWLLECPVCYGLLLGQADMVRIGEDVWDYERLTRLWPEQKNEDHIDYAIPEIVRKSLLEGQKCFKAKAYPACAVMCGRAIEGICSDQNTSAKNLAGGLKELKDKGIIDGRLSEWGDALRQRRNIGAHATEEDTTKEDAKDVLDFAVAICEYVYVLSEKFEEFKLRDAKRKANKTQ